MYVDDLIEPWHRRLADDLGRPPVVDVHTHTGANDPDGYNAREDELLAALDLIGARGAVFTMHEPGGYPEANDRVLAEAERSGGRLAAFCRLDPADEPLAEAERCLAAGAAGIKLHPRAERFQLGDPRLEGVFALAGERHLPVLVHAGRGIPALGRHALEVCERHPGLRLILAHAGICDLSWIWRHAADRPNLFFDTSWWSPDDLLALFRLVPPGQVLLGSDAPYGTPLSCFVVTMRCALQAGVSREAACAVAGEQAARLLAGDDPLDLGPAPGDPLLPADVLLGRVATFLSGAVTQMVRGEDATEYLALARLACDVPGDAPRSAVFRSVEELLARIGSEPRPDEARNPFSPGTHLVIAALAVARTPDVPVPGMP